MDVDIWSDIACPWCYVGKRRLEAALESFEHSEEVEVRWHSFELDPQAPAEREGEAASNLAGKYGMSREQALGALQRMTETAAADGLEFHFERARAGNTFDAHRLTHLALANDLQDRMKERLMRAYLTEGELISDHPTLRRLALEVGLPEQPVEELLAGDRFAEEVRTDEYTASRLGITAVPFFVVDRRLGAAGAQEPAYLLEMLRRGWAEREPAVTAPGAGQACSVEGC
jgi:predicted DsbA family dithiol-disulfide isomerase